VVSITGDGAYDRNDVYAEVVVVPPRSGTVPSKAAGTAPTQSDRHIEDIAERGRLGWQKASGYNWHALMEANISRWKRVIGDGLHSQTDRRQVAEVAIAADVLNRMLDLGRPKYIRTARPGTRVRLNAPTRSTRATSCRHGNRTARLQVDPGDTGRVVSCCGETGCSSLCFGLSQVIKA
jgi:hypothetical protein